MDKAFLGSYFGDIVRSIRIVLFILAVYTTGPNAYADQDLAAEAKKACAYCHHGYSYADGKCECSDKAYDERVKYLKGAVDYLQTTSSCASDIQSAVSRYSSGDIARKDYDRTLDKVKNRIEKSWKSSYQPARSNVTTEYANIDGMLQQTYSYWEDALGSSSSKKITVDDAIHLTDTCVEDFLPGLKRNLSESREEPSARSTATTQVSVEDCFNKCEVAEKKHRLKKGQSYEDCLGSCK
jgi:hypothetical protein